jgi:hypothetical protein
MRMLVKRPIAVCALLSGAWVLAFGQAPVVVVKPVPAELVRRVVENEMTARRAKTHLFMFRSHHETLNLNQDKLYVETKDALAGMVTAWNNQPLTPELRKAEEERLDHLLSDPEELRHKQKQERENYVRIVRIIRAMPDAFLFEYDGTATGKATVGGLGKELVRVKFHPNPDYDPPTRIEQILTGMEGTVLVDPRTHRFASIDGTLVRDVGFGWSIFGHLDEGGSFRAEQYEFSPGVWVPSLMAMRFTGKLMLFKSLNFKSRETYHDFRPVPPDMSFAQGIEVLKKENAAVAQNRPASSVH